MDPIVIRSLNVGGVRIEIDTNGRRYESAVRRIPQQEPQYLAARGFAGDASYEPCHHTPNLDVHVFCFEHYAHYEALAGTAFPIPAFGENFTTTGALETDVCIGDRYSVGTALVEVSQPTERCGTPGRSLGIPELRKWIHAALFSGYYLRVIRPGTLSVGDALVLRERPLPTWSVDRINRATFERLDDGALYEEVLALPFLASDWKARMGVLHGRKRSGERNDDGTTDLSAGARVR